MQDRYAGDTPDFGKYLLLRHLHRETGLRLGINWYRTRPEDVDHQSNNDGETRHHISLPHIYEDADSDLYEKLRQFEHDQNRTIERLEKSGIFPTETRFFNDFLCFWNQDKAAREETRKNWFSRSVDALKECDIIFMDPDTGPAPTSRIESPYRKESPKYAYPDEMSAHLEKGQSVMIIRFIRQYKGGIEKAVQHTFDIFRDRGLMKDGGFAIEFPSGRNSTYFILPAQSHREILLKAMESLLSGSKSHLFRPRP